MKKKIDVVLRQEIQSVLMHQESLMQQYRTLLYTIQSLLFGTFTAVYVGLWSAQTSRGPLGYCVSSLKGLVFFESLYLVVFCILVTIAAVGLLVLCGVMSVIARRGELITICQRLLMLDELGLLEDVLSRCLSQADGTRAGIQLALQILEGRRFISPRVRDLYPEFRPEELRCSLRAVELSATARSGREMFNEKIPRYFFGLWFTAGLALYCYVFGVVTC